jgi:hypothetical protein
MELMKPLFMTVSNLELAALASKRFYFTNIYQNKVNIAAGVDVFYLSKTIINHNPATNYLPGDFVFQAGNVYEAIKTSTGVTPPNTASWQNREKNQYASKDDLLQFIPAQHVFSVLPAATTAEVSLFALNTATNVFDVQVYHQAFNYESTVKEVAVDLSALPEAKYRAVVNGTETFVYISNDAVYNNLFGVVDLYNALSNGNDFAFFDATGKLKDQVVASKNVWLNFTIRFANKLAFWKYIVPKKGVQAIVSTPPGIFTGNASPADFFTSGHPIPLKEAPQEFKLTLFQPVSTEPPVAPNPDVHASGMLSKSGDDYYCNIYLNY